MMSIHALFWSFLILFTIIGVFRGFRKEFVVSQSVILSLAIIALLREFVPMFAAIPEDSIDFFWIQTGSLLFMVLIGYQTVQINRFSERLRDIDITNRFLGGIIGALNGYLIIGSLWYFLIQANYPFTDFIVAPVAGTGWGDATLHLQSYLIHFYITSGWLYGITLGSMVLTILLLI